MTALEPAISAPVATPFPRQSTATQPDSAIWQRARKFCGGVKPGMPVLIPAELVSACVVDLPAASVRQRTALLTYAVEDRIAAPVETVLVAQAPLLSAVPGRVLALIIAKDALAHLTDHSPETGAMPDFLLIRRPDAPVTGLAWAVWREAARAVVRVSDGTGFAVNVDMLPLVWALAGKPVLTSLGAALPTSLPALDLSAAPPDPDPADLRFRFATARSVASRHAGLRPLVQSAIVGLAALAVMLGLAVADTVALGRIAAAQQAAAQSALSGVLPGVTVGPDVDPILSRLTPVATQPQQGAFLPLMSAVSDALAQAGPPVSLRRLTWDDQQNQMSLTVQAAGLDDLQTIEQHLTATGFSVVSGAATAGDGGAEVDLSITGPLP